MKVNDQDAEAGCYIAGHLGQYAIDELAVICDQYDINVPAVDNPLTWRKVADADNLDEAYGPDGKLYKPEDAWEQHHGAGDVLENLLNDLTEGGVWTWEDGEFFLQQTEVERWLFVTDTDYEAAWQQVVTCAVNEHAGYTDQYQATELADEVPDEQVYQFRITVRYEHPDN